MGKMKKMSLANIQGKLSRAEMKKIMGGSDSDPYGDIGDGDTCGSYTCGSCANMCKCGDSKNGPCVPQ